MAEIVRGNGKFTGGAAKRQVASPATNAEGDISLDFSNVDIRDVVKAVLGDLLKLNYTVDGKVQGVVTIQTSHPLKRDAVLPVFEQAIRLSGLAIVKSGDLYQVVTSNDAPRQNMVPLFASSHAAAQPGFGIEIVPLKYVGATDMKQLLDPLVPAGGILQIDPSRNLLILGGTEQERAMVLEDIALFDADWLSGMSFALYTPKSVTAKELAKELGLVIGGRESPLNGMVRLVPIERLNIVLAISPQPQYLEKLQQWVERFDRPGESVDERIYVYRVQNGRAVDLAAVLNKVLSNNDGASPSARASQDEDRTAVNRQALPASIPGQPIPQPNDARPSGAVGGDGNDQGIRVNGVNAPSIIADEINNALVIRSTPREFAVIEAALSQLDITPLQVFLEAAVAEVTLKKELKFGLQYFFQSGKSNKLSLTESTTAAISPSFPGFSYSFINGNKIQAILSALETVTNVDVVSSPQVMVVNNQTATLQVGDQVPVATQQAVNVTASGAPIVNSIQYRDTGITLKVTPRVNQGGMVMMDISQEVSDVSTTTSSTLNSPTIQQRKVTSTVAVQDGETVALGGLIKNSKNNTDNGIPYLQDIPYLGNLFQSRDDQGGRTELLILITPHLVENSQKARLVTEELRQKLSKTQALFQQVK